MKARFHGFRRTTGIIWIAAIFFFCLLPKETAAQSETNFFSSHLLNFTETTDNHYAKIEGNKYPIVLSPQRNIYFVETNHLIMADLAGKQKWAIPFNLSDVPWTGLFSEFVKGSALDLDDNLFMIINSKQWQLGTTQITNTTSISYLCKVNAKGEVVWIKSLNSILPSLKSPTSRVLKIGPNGNPIVSGLDFYAVLSTAGELISLNLGNPVFPIYEIDEMNRITRVVSYHDIQNLSPFGGAYISTNWVCRFPNFEKVNVIVSLKVDTLGAVYGQIRPAYGPPVPGPQQFIKVENGNLIWSMNLNPKYKPGNTDFSLNLPPIPIDGEGNFYFSNTTNIQSFSSAKQSRWNYATDMIPILAIDVDDLICVKSNSVYRLSKGTEHPKFRGKFSVKTSSTITGGRVKELQEPIYSLTITNVILTAEADTNYQFVEWEGDFESVSPQIEATLVKHAEVKPVFGTQITVVPNPQGEITTVPPVAVFPLNSLITFYAKPKSGFKLARWNGNPSLSNASLTMEVKQPNPSVSAVFEPLPENEFILYAVATVGGSVFQIEEVTGNLVPLKNSYPKNSVIRLRAVPKPDATFLGWSGDVVSRESILTNTVIASINLSARFAVNSKLTWPGYGRNISQYKNPVPLIRADRGAIHDLFSSTNSFNWTFVERVTNTVGLTEIPVSPRKDKRLEIFKVLPAAN